MAYSWNKIQMIFSKLIYIIGLSIPLIITLGRILIPDTSFDTINYHTFIGERGWKWLNFSKVEFYPTTMHSFFPFLDMINSIGRYILGYRLGAIVQTIFLYISIILIFKLLSLLNLSTGSQILDSILKINVFISLETLFQLGSYFNDIISSFFVILSIYLFILYYSSNINIFIILSTITISCTVLFKYTNYIYFIPYFILLITEIMKENQNNSAKFKEILLHLSIFLLINTPWMFWNYINTQNPIFPYFNGIFKSEFFDLTSFRFDQGPKNVLESLIYPIYLFFDNTKLGQYHDIIPDYKISFYILLLFISYPLFKKYYSNKKEFWILYKFFILIYIVWVFLFGYARYAIPFEFIAGILLMGLIKSIKILFTKKKSIIVSILIIVPFLWQDIHFIKNNFIYDISWRPTLWDNNTYYLNEINNINNNKIFFPNLENVDVYLACGNPNLGYMVPSNAINLPVLTLPSNNFESVEERNYRIKAVNKIPNIINKEYLDFVTILNLSTIDSNKKECLNLLNSFKSFITSIDKTSFLGYDHIKLELIKGQIRLDLIIN